jgi:hypothetical protein
MGEACPHSNISLPCANMSWSLGGQALYLSTTKTGPAAVIGAALDSNGVSNIVSGDPGWGWGFQISAAYQFSSGKDFNVNWYHLNYSKNKPPFINNINDLLDGPNISYLANLKSEWDAVNLEFGQEINISDTSNLHYYGGAQFSRILGSTKLTRTSNATFATGASEYNGFGPRVGADLNYTILPKFNIYGKAATTLLIGTNKQSIDDRNAFLNINGNTTSLILHGSYMRLVPAIEGKLGGNYVLIHKTGQVIIDVGYLWVNYFNPLQVYVYESNVAFNGLYFGANWKGNIA